MKRTFLKAAVVALIAANSFAITSCNNEEMVQEKTPEQISPEIIERFEDLGFDASDLEMQGENYLVEGDIIVTPEALANMKEPVIVNGPKGEQFRTYNLVSAPRTITVRGSGLSTKASTALDMAIQNYNNENLSITFTRVSSGGDIVVQETGTSAGGVAGFPYGNGDPYNSVTIYGGTTSYSTDVVEHVITHELGHCIGFRHTDWFDRSYSCGSGGSEGEGSVGAVGIPGTVYYDANSIMNSCFSSSETGEFSSYDVVALNYLY